MNNFITIMKKELKRFFGDRRMLISLFLPGILLFLIYNVMGSFMNDALSANEDHTYLCHIENMPEEYQTLIENSNYKIEYVDIESLDDIKESIKEQNLDISIIFDDNFNEKIENGIVPNVSIYYNSSSPESLEIYTYTYSILLSKASNVSYDFLVNMDSDINYDLASNEDMSAMIITMILPFLLIVLLFTGCVSIATESIAGEKERGTIATLLVTPTSRTSIALGKILALSITSLTSALVSFLGVILSLPKLLQAESTGITLSMYDIDTYLGILGIIVVTVMFFTTFLSILSTFAKNIKEASQWSSIAMILVTILGVSSMVNTSFDSSRFAIYLIPIYNSVQCMSSIFSLSFNGLHFVITIISNLIYIGLGIYILTKMFNSEKIMSSN